MKGLLKKNQIIIYVIAIMLMTAGYLNYTTKQGGDSVETSIEMDSKDDTKLADIGDATLVSSNDIVGGDTTDTNTVNTTQNENTNNTNSTNISNTANNTNTNNSTQNTIATSSNASKDDYFTKSKLERDTMYSQMLETYEKVLNSSNSLETQKQMICENLIKTKGFENVIIFVNGESISVIVGIEELKQEEVAQIQNIVARELNCKVENIHISTK